MCRLGFILFWTIGSTLSVAVNLAGNAQTAPHGAGAAFLLAFPVFGLICLRLEWRRFRRRRSLHEDVRDGVTVYSWVEFDGTERISTADPRSDWDDADGDGDGDGGD